MSNARFMIKKIAIDLLRRGGIWPGSERCDNGFIFSLESYKQVDGELLVCEGMASSTQGGSGCFGFVIVFGN